MYVYLETFRFIYYNYYLHLSDLRLLLKCCITSGQNTYLINPPDFSNSLLFNFNLSVLFLSFLTYLFNFFFEAFIWPCYCCFFNDPSTLVTIRRSERGITCGIFYFEECKTTSCKECNQQVDMLEVEFWIVQLIRNNSAVVSHFFQWAIIETLKSRCNW